MNYLLVGIRFMVHNQSMLSGKYLTVIHKHWKRDNFQKYSRFVKG